MTQPQRRTLLTLACPSYRGDGDEGSRLMTQATDDLTTIIQGGSYA